MLIKLWGEEMTERPKVDLSEFLNLSSQIGHLAAQKFQDSLPLDAKDIIPEAVGWRAEGTDHQEKCNMVITTIAHESLKSTFKEFFSVNLHKNFVLNPLSSWQKRTLSFREMKNLA